MQTVTQESVAIGAGLVAKEQGDVAKARRLAEGAADWLRGVDPTWRAPAVEAAEGWRATATAEGWREAEVVDCAFRREADAVALAERLRADVSRVIEARDTAEAERARLSIALDDARADNARLRDKVAAIQSDRDALAAAAVPVKATPAPVQPAKPAPAPVQAPAATSGGVSRPAAIPEAVWAGMSPQIRAYAAQRAPAVPAPLDVD